MDKIYKNIIGYVLIDEENSFKNKYIKKQKLDKIKTFLDTIGIKDKEVFIDEGFVKSIWENPQIQKIMNKITLGEVNVFIINSIFDLGNNFIDSIDFMKYLVENNVRLICIDNNIDTTMFFS